MLSFLHFFVLSVHVHPTCGPGFLFITRAVSIVVEQRVRAVVSVVLDFALDLLRWSLVL